MTRALENRLVKVEDHFGLDARHTTDGNDDPTPEQWAASRACLVELIETRQGPLTPAELTELHARLDAAAPVRLSDAGRQQLAALLAEKVLPNPHLQVDGTDYERPSFGFVEPGSGAGGPLPHVERR